VRKNNNKVARNLNWEQQGAQGMTYRLACHLKSQAAAKHEQDTVVGPVDSDKHCPKNDVEDNRQKTEISAEVPHPSGDFWGSRK
jgi:hypothetical protein